MTSVRRLEIRVDQTGNAASGIKGIAGSVGKIAKVGMVAGAAALGGIALLTGAVLGLGSKLTGLGANAEEMEAKFDAVFGEGAPAAAKELDEFGNAVGRNKFALMEMASTLQDTFVPMGFARDNAADMSLEMTKLAVDVGSFNNVLAPDVMEDFQSALVGNHETVLKYGIIINEATLKAKAFEMGLIKMSVSSADVESAQVKLTIAQAKYNEVMAGGTVDTEKVRAAQVNLALANDKAALASRKHTLVLEEHDVGSTQAQASAIRLASANERVTKAQARLTKATTVGAVSTSTKLAATERLRKAEDALTSALAGEAGAMDDTAKVLARKQIIIDGTTDAQGDAIKTSGSWTNQMLALKESFTEGATEMGLYLNQALLPLLSEFSPWVKDLMPRAVEIFKRFAGNLSTTVGPAIALIKDAIIRIAEAFGVQTEDVSSADVVMMAFEKTLGAIVTALQLTALAFQAVAGAVEIAVGLWGQIKIMVGAAWVTLKQVAAISLHALVGWIESIRHAVGTVTGYWNSLKNAAVAVADISFHAMSVGIESVRHAVGTVSGYFDSMRDAARKAIDAIPDWLRPGSPTPFEVGLRGISQAAKDIDLSMGMAGMGRGENRAMAGAGRGGGTNVTINLTYSPAISLADRYEVQEKLTPFILGALRTAGVAPS